MTLAEFKAWFDGLFPGCMGLHVAYLKIIEEKLLTVDDKCCCEYSKLETIDINGRPISVKNPDNTTCNCNYCKLLAEREKLDNSNIINNKLELSRDRLIKLIEIRNKEIMKLEAKTKIFCPRCGSLSEREEPDNVDYDCRIKCTMCHAISYASL